MEDVCMIHLEVVGIITFHKNDLIGKMYANIENYKIYQ